MSDVLQPLDLALYLVGIVWKGIHVGRRHRTAEDFFLAGRNVVGTAGSLYAGAPADRTVGDAARGRQSRGTAAAGRERRRSGLGWRPAPRGRALVRPLRLAVRRIAGGNGGAGDRFRLSPRRPR